MLEDETGSKIVGRGRLTSIKIRSPRGANVNSVRSNLLVLDHVVAPLDYKCKEGRFLVSALCVTISNPDLLSCSETWVNSEIRS